MENDTPSQRHQKKVGIAILISGKINFKLKEVTRDKDGQYIMIKGTIHQADTTSINNYAPNVRVSKYMKYNKRPKWRN